jgi:hypothetical protein
VFRRWLEQDYQPAECHCSLNLEAPGPIPCGRPVALRVRCRNTGTTPWAMHPGSNAGIHAGFNLYGPGDVLVGTGRAGLFEAAIPPGQQVEVTMVLPALETPGRYRVVVDMVDEQQGWFSQFGSEPLEEELEARAQDPATAD